MQLVTAAQTRCQPETDLSKLLLTSTILLQIVNMPDSYNLVLKLKLSAVLLTRFVRLSLP
jgi:hypothetical protein